jgi:hypothetical protein
MPRSACYGAFSGALDTRPGYFPMLGHYLKLITTATPATSAPKKRSCILSSFRLQTEHNLVHTQFVIHDTQPCNPKAMLK